jgi:peroxiredoxin
MRLRFHLPLLLGSLAFAAAALAPEPSAALVAPKKAVCVVCNEGEEPVKATATYQGKEHYFCGESCKAKFLADPSAYLKATTPRPAPAFTLKDLSGKTVSLSDYKGKVVLLDFWATFCGPCLKAMPKLQKLNDRYAARGFAVVGIATDEEGAKIVAPSVAKTKVTYPILLTDESAWKRYDVKTLPAMFLIDQKGQIVKQFGGTTEVKVVEQELLKLLGERGSRP